MKAHVIFPVALALAGTLLALSPAQAQTKLVTLSNIGILNGHGPFFVQFNLANGISAPDGNATATISNFSLTGGSLGASTTIATAGNTTGNLGTALVLDDGNAVTAGFSSFQQGFTITSSASTLSFNLNLAATSTDAGTPDDFYFQILNSAGNPLATNGPNGTELVNASYASTKPTPLGFITQATSSVNADTNYPTITATISAPAVPEASTTVSLGLLLLLGGVGVWRARRRSAAN